MKTRISFCSLTIFMMVVLFAAGLSAQTGNELVTPESYFGFKPGSDRMLFTYEDLIAYLKEVDNYSPRLKMVEIGKSPQGRVMYIAFISSAENIKNLDRLRDINKSLALDPSLSEQERSDLIKEGRVFLLATLSMHSGEVAPSQSPEL